MNEIKYTVQLNQYKEELAACKKELAQAKAELAQYKVSDLEKLQTCDLRCVCVYRQYSPIIGEVRGSENLRQ